jgi:hypothetical protein
MVKSVWATSEFQLRQGGLEVFDDFGSDGAIIRLRSKITVPFELLLTMQHPG